MASRASRTAGVRGHSGTFQISCERCRSRKIKCDKVQPCCQCSRDNVDCKFRGTGEKRRPVQKQYVEALEGQIAWLEKFIFDLARASPEERDRMLAHVKGGDAFERLHPGDSLSHSFSPTPAATSSSPSSSLARGLSPPSNSNYSAIHSGRLLRLRNANLSQFYGPTSFQIAPGAASESEQMQALVASRKYSNMITPESDSLHFILAPQSDNCRHLMSTFFLRLYPYHMHFYREFFLRDLHAGGGPYYSNLLMYAICSVAALVSKDATMRQFSEVFSERAQELLYNGGLDAPDITVLQALLLLSHRETGQGNGSKGWLYAGMAFRLAHEMGLHLDPDNWEPSEDTDIEREIRRRTYWGAFTVDKWTSLYYGRPPALSPRESDVRDTVRIPYPACWPSSILDPTLLNDSFSGKRTPQDEDGAALIGTLTYKIELARIVHRMLTNVFEIRDSKTDETVLAATVSEIHLSLTKWLSELPSKLHWNQWSVGAVEPYVLVLHMLYHTIMIVLHRPSLQLSRSPNAAELAESRDFDICWQSTTSIIKLIRAYSRGNEYIYLPMTFVHTATSTASIILLKRHTQGLVNHGDDEPSKFLNTILEALEGCSATWFSAAQAKRAIMMADREAFEKNAVEVGGAVEGTSRKGNVSAENFAEFLDLDLDNVELDMEFDMTDVMNIPDLSWLDSIPSEVGGPALEQRYQIPGPYDGAVDGPFSVHDVENGLLR